MQKIKIRNLPKLRKNLRFEVCKLSNQANAAHLGSSLSCMDILISVFFSNVFNFDIKKNSKDKFILSKGHAAAALYACLAEKGFINKKILTQYGKNNSIYEEHPNFKINGVLTATGSLGHGLSFACGMALAEKIQNKRNKIIVVLSDGECNEGTVWEAASFASTKKLNNIIAFLDYNKWQATGRSNEIFGGNFLKKWKSFGWNAIQVDGYNISKITNAIKKCNTNKPSIIICDTIKGSGIKFMEDNNNWHYRIPKNYELNQIKKILKL